MFHCRFPLGVVTSLLAGTFWFATTYAVEIKLPENECSFAGNFVQKISMPALPDPILSEGEFFYHCQHGVIWSTTEPVQETLVLSQTGQTTIITPETSKPLNSQPGKFLSSLLNSLMGGNVETLQTQFEIEQVNTSNQTYLLTPKRHSLKRAVKKIFLSVIRSDDSGKSNQVEIVILDRNDQATEISSQKTQSFDIKEPTLNACQSTIQFLQRACDHLLAD